MPLPVAEHVSPLGDCLVASDAGASAPTATTAHALAAQNLFISTEVPGLYGFKRRPGSAARVFLKTVR
jgi:hypothetical protein